MDARRPIIPLAVEEDEDHVQLHADGTWRAAPRIIFSPEDMGRIKAGYACARCYEVQDRPFPKECKVCKFPMDERQLEFIAKAYQGETRLGPTTSLEDELALLEETEELMAREALGFKPSNSIFLPRGI